MKTSTCAFQRWFTSTLTPIDPLKQGFLFLKIVPCDGSVFISCVILKSLLRAQVFVCTVIDFSVSCLTMHLFKPLIFCLMHIFVLYRFMFTSVFLSVVMPNPCLALNLCNQFIHVLIHNLILLEHLVSLPSCIFFVCVYL